MDLVSVIRNAKGVLIAYAVLGVALWPVPLLGLLHVEAAAVVAFAAFFVAGLSALRLFREGWGFGAVLGVQEAALVVPWALLTVTLLWRPNCGYAQGLLFYLLFPVVTVGLAVALAYALSGSGLRRKRAVLAGIGLAVAIGGPLYDLGFHPQFYTYNHVFGGVLGPVYDEELALRLGLFAFRGLTLLWALLLFLIGRRLRRGTAQGLAGGVAVVLLIGVCYLFSARLGFNTPAWYLQEKLGGVHRTAHFDLYFDPDEVSPEEVRYLAEDHEYRYAWLEERLATEGPGRIRSYLYPSPEVKARLTGARSTSVAPVWLPRPQVHVLASAYEESFGHELAHVFSRPYGLPVLNASVSVGLVEGWAVALEPPDGRPSPHEQVLTAAFKDLPPGEMPTIAEELTARLSPQGFWTGRQAVSYTTMGSFVRFLLERYGAARLKAIYAWADFEDVYGKPVAVLAAEWQRFLLDLPLVASDTEALVARRFTVPSLFEKRCPHHVPRHLRAYRAGEEALAQGDTLRAAQRFEAALRQEPGFVPARLARARIALARDEAAEVVQVLDAVAAEQRSPGFYVTLGDAYVLLGRPDAARAHYAEAPDGLPLYAHSARAQVVLRDLLAERPDAVRVLTTGASAAQKADQMEALQPQTPALQMQRAVLLMAADQYEPAGWLLRSMGVPQGLTEYQRALLSRQRLVWMAQSVYRAGRPDVAATYAYQAAEAFRAAGAQNEAARLQDFINKLEWVQRTRPFLARASAH